MTTSRLYVRRFGLIVALASLSVTAPTGQSDRPLASKSPIDPDRLTAHVKTLASDEFEGRAPATAGEAKTLDYLIRELVAAGVQPGGERDAQGSRRWTQDVPLSQSEIQGAVTAIIMSGKGTRLLQHGEHVAFRATHLPTDGVSIKDAPLVFVGYGIHAPDRQWDDFKGVDLRGKIGVVLVNDPDFEVDLGGRFGGKAMTYYGRWTYKFEEAARRGALGMLVVHETAPAAYGWDTVKNSSLTAMFDIVRSNPADVHPLLEGWMQREVAVDLFRRAGTDFETEKLKAQTAQFTPVVLAGTTLSVEYRVKQTRVVSKNVVGLLAGTTDPDETVIYSAHWDHLGVGEPDATGDRIYNGARDNALGVAGLLEIARVYAAAPRTRRSVVLLSVTAEEKGLLGSEYYAAHPLYPPALTAAVYNMDGGSVVGPTWDIAIAGEGKISLEEDLASAARLDGRRFSPDPRPEAGSFFRSDHFSFAKAGVPAISFRVGLDLVEGGIAAGKAAADEHIAKRYHQPSDEWLPSWNLRGAVMDFGLLYSVGRDLANSGKWPEWREGSEFKATRHATRSTRK